jgi:hypothetical protein
VRKARPVLFDVRIDGPLFGAGGSSYAQQYGNRILSGAIPVLTLPVGASHLDRTAQFWQWLDKGHRIPVWHLYFYTNSYRPDLESLCDIGAEVLSVLLRVAGDAAVNPVVVPAQGQEDAFGTLGHFRGENSSQAPYFNCPVR